MNLSPLNGIYAELYHIQAGTEPVADPKSN